MMSSRRVENRPPRSPNSKKGTVIEVPLDKRRRIGVTRPGGPTSTVRGRQALTEVNARQDASSAANSSTMEGVESEVIEFTKEGVETLLNEKPKAKRHETKARMDHLTDYNKRLKLCIKWFQQVEESHLLEKDRLQNALESAEKRCSEIEMEKEKKVEELNANIAELRSSNASLEEKIMKESSEKLEALDSYAKENDARVAAERLQASLSAELEKSKLEKLDVDQQIAAQKDMYKRLQEYNTSLQQYNSKLQTDLSTATESLKRAEKEKMAIVENLSTLRGHYNTLQEQLSTFRASADEANKVKDTLANEVKCLREELQKVRDDRDRQIGQNQALTADLSKYKETTGKSAIELDNLTTKINALQETCSSQMEQIHILQHQLTAANEKLKMADLSTMEMRSEYEKQKSIISDLQDRLANSEQQVLEGEQLRKKLHNTILELKGNIRVFCRVRPLLPDESYGSEPVISYPTSTESLGRGIELVQSGGQKYPFTFDKVFNPEASQEDVFFEISQLIQSALDGYKVCIFAYGQTGSGKTYTMMGKPAAPGQKGLIPRSLEQIFQTSQALSAQGWKYRLQASVLEIYNETIRDLLLTNRSQGLEIMRNEGGAGGKQYTIKHDANGMTHVSDLTIVDVASVKELSMLLEQAAQSRSVGKTQMNEQSSRSHFVFTLRIYGTNENTEQQVHGVLNLIDLAGSERLSKSGATGDRLKETQAINKSLSSLSDVIFALAKKEDHVPFRNSKLTYLLQPCLGGDSKTLMFVNISPEPTSVGESLCSLRFAARVNACEIGIPRRQTSMRLVDSRLSCG